MSGRGPAQPPSLFETSPAIAPSGAQEIRAPKLESRWHVRLPGPGLGIGPYKALEGLRRTLRAPGCFHRGAGFTLAAGDFLYSRPLAPRPLMITNRYPHVHKALKGVIKSLRDSCALMAL